MNKKWTSLLIGFIGFILSPITWWNDAFINIPISYLCASYIAYFSPKLFSVSLIIFYWLTNILGVFLMYISGKNFFYSFKITFGKQFIIITLYTVIIVILSLQGIIKPLLVK